MRRTALALFVPLALLSACSDSKSEGAGTTVADAGGTPAKPSVALPAELPTELVITDLVEGTGPEAASGDSVVVHYVGVLSADGTEFDNSYDRGEPFEVVLGQGRVIQGWEQGLIGAQQGTRRQLDIPADLAYGDTGSGDVIKPGAAISFVVDVIAVLPTSSATDQPDISVAAAENSAEISYTDLIVGDGVSPTEGTTFAVRIIAYRADTGELLTSSWGSTPATFLFGEGTDSFPGLIAAVDGMKVGGRRQAQIPFAQMFNGLGNEELGLPADVDLTVVLDLVAVY